MDTTSEILHALRSIIICLIEDKNQLVIDAIPQPNRHTLIEVRATKRDAGAIIGKDGRNARALRTLVGSIGLKAGRVFTLDITPL
ncbi:KH domain-containing protein [Terriglobus albidus]|uniref:KH domain-containing protein n=1 Tax=Terriglobus albidus TaxID=1592106 RepID=UPI0037D9955F